MCSVSCAARWLMTFAHLMCSLEGHRDRQSTWFQCAAGGRQGLRAGQSVPPKRQGAASEVQMQLALAGAAPSSLLFSVCTGRRAQQCSCVCSALCVCCNKQGAAAAFVGSSQHASGVPAHSEASHPLLALKSRYKLSAWSRSSVFPPCICRWRHMPLLTSRSNAPVMCGVCPTASH